MHQRREKGQSRKENWKQRKKGWCRLRTLLSWSERGVYIEDLEQNYLGRSAECMTVSVHKAWPFKVQGMTDSNSKNGEISPIWPFFVPAQKFQNLECRHFRNYKILSASLQPSRTEQRKPWQQCNLRNCKISSARPVHQSRTAESCVQQYRPYSPCRGIYQRPTKPKTTDR